MLSTKDALDLYTKLAEFVPEYKEKTDSLDFTGKIIHNMSEKNKQEVFGECLLLMFPDITIEDLSEMTGLKALELFVDGLAENKFLTLVKFCRSIGYG